MNKKKKILFLTDDPRFSSGIATISREILLNTVHKFDFVVVGGAMKHPEEGKIIDMNEAIRKETGVDDANVKIYPVSGYGTQELVRHLIMAENPDIILHFTDPRYWTWLYQMEHEIRQLIPISYLTIWDSPPPPMYNKAYYRSCDLLMCISKQTYGLVNKVLKGYEHEPHQITYVPHGLNENTFYPIDSSMPEYQLVQERRKSYLKGNEEPDFVLLLNSRNIRRKQIPDVIMAFKLFVQKNSAKNAVLVLHTAPIDENGTNLFEVYEKLAPEINLVFSSNQLSPQDMNILYNTSDVVINISSNEGWGLSITEARLVGKPIIVNMTGGLQDQVGLKVEIGDNEYRYITEEDYLDSEFHSNHTGKYKICDDYASAIIPSNLSLQGSVPTPYIYDDRVKIEDVTDAIQYWYHMPKAAREILGIDARESAIKVGHTAAQMSDRIIHDIETCLENFKPRDKYTLIKSKNDR